MTPTCETCRYWEPDETPAHRDDAQGDCHRQAPVPILYGFAEAAFDRGNGAAHYLAYWPMTSSIDWCGEHQPKPSAPKADE